MDSKKCHLYYKGHRSAGFQCNNPFYKNTWDGKSVCTNFDYKSKYTFFKSSKLQKHPYNIRKKEFSSDKNFKSKHLHRKQLRDGLSNVSERSVEDAEEEERRRKLSDTANKLLSKIKSWNAERVDVGSKRSESEFNGMNEALPSNNVIKVQNDIDCDVQMDMNSRSSNNSSIKPRRIAHSKSKSGIGDGKKLTGKTKIKLTKMPNEMKFEVNNTDVKNFQNKIQCKLIDKIMQMPKENLQNMLNDPKINPAMQVEISHLVKENKVLIAQKLRALAESKMALNDSSLKSEILLDIEKLIDPVIETDLSVLPYELIKDLEDMFQVQFEYSKIRNDTGTEALNICNNDLLKDQLCNSSSEFEQVSEMLKATANEAGENELYYNDFSKNNNFSEACSEKTVNTPLDILLKKTLITKDEEMSQKYTELYQDNKSDELKGESENSEGNVCEKLTSFDYECSKCENSGISASSHIISNTGSVQIHPENPLKNNLPSKSGCSRTFIDSAFVDSGKSSSSTNTSSHSNSVNINSHKSLNKVSVEDGSRQESFTDQMCISPSSPSTSLKNQSKVILKTEGTQASLGVNESGTLYGMPLPKESHDESEISLLEEVNTIQNLVNKLNERRFLIFLKLARLNPNGEFASDAFTRLNFIETISNGNIYLTDSLKEFFLHSKTDRACDFRTYKLKN